jgi:DMSO/TMAO reductase YedYZ molybdopterin-dependent catalytic subunit
MERTKMKYWIAGIVLIVVLSGCSSPAVLPAEPTVTSSPSAEATPEPTEASSPTAEPTRAPTEERAAALLDTEIIHMHPSEVDNSTLPITALEDLHRTGRPQDYDINTWRLAVDGLVESPLSLTYEDLLSRPQVSELVLLICPGFFWDNATWTGTPLGLILEEAGVSAQATQILIQAGDGYSRKISLEDAVADGVFLAYEVNGETLPKEHGHPIRLVMRDHFGSKWVKWIERIEVIE